MADKLKQNLRYYKASLRLLKTIYPKDKNMRRLCKLDEQINQISKHNNSLWSEIYLMGYVPNVDNSNPKFFKYFDMILSNSKKITSLTKSIGNMEKKGFKLETALHMKFLLNKGRASQSF